MQVLYYFVVSDNLTSRISPNFMEPAFPNLPAAHGTDEPATLCYGSWFHEIGKMANLVNQRSIHGQSAYEGLRLFAFSLIECSKWCKQHICKSRIHCPADHQRKHHSIWWEVVVLLVVTHTSASEWAIPLLMLIVTYGGGGVIPRPCRPHPRFVDCGRIWATRDGCLNTIQQIRTISDL